MVFPGEGFEPEAVLNAVQEERCTGLHGVPTMFIAVLDHPRFKEFDLSTLRTGIMAGSPCPIEVMKRVAGEMNMREITIAYGMTETSPVSFQSSVDDPLERRVATVGRIQPHLEVKIVDVEGRIVPVGTPGELLTRGYSRDAGLLGRRGADAARRSTRRAGCIPAIWRRWTRTATATSSGASRTWSSGAARTSIRARSRSSCIRHPKVADVQVFGVPDERFGEELCAWITLQEGRDADRGGDPGVLPGQIAHYKVPRYVRFVEAFPMTVTGKIQKFIMRQKMIEELKLEISKTA